MTSPGPVRAAVDCGTNSTRVLVADGAGVTLERLMRITRLGQGVDAEGRLAPEAVERTLEVLREYRRVMDRHGVELVRATATSAARDSDNRVDFMAAAAEILGTPLEILSGTEEAELAFRGATAELDPDDGPFLVVDIGGGSTELAVGTTEPEGTLSIDVGCVRITERFLHSDPPRPEELHAALSLIRDHIEDLSRDLPAVVEARRLVGLAGTVTTAAAVELGLPRYDRDRIHHFELTREAAEDVFRTLATEPRARRAHNPGLEAERVDVIVGGMVVLVAFLRYLQFDRCLVSEADLLDGLVMSLGDRAAGRRT